jgi:hypothetical protein
MSVSEEILVFLFRRERVEYLEIGDVRGGGGWHMMLRRLAEGGKVNFHSDFGF